MPIGHPPDLFPREITSREQNDLIIRASADLLDDRVDRYLRMGCARGAIGLSSRRENGQEGQEWGAANGHACDVVRTPSLQAIVTSAGRDSAFILRIT